MQPMQSVAGSMQGLSAPQSQQSQQQTNLSTPSSPKSVAKDFYQNNTRKTSLDANVMFNNQQSQQQLVREFGSRSTTPPLIPENIKTIDSTASLNDP
eukprot:Pgem_evm1s15014